MSNDNLNLYINYLINNELKGKKIKVNYKQMTGLLNEQICEIDCISFSDINFSRYKYGEDKVRLAFGFRDINVTIRDFFFYYFENNIQIENIISIKNKINLDTVRAIQRLITGVLLGYECTTILDIKNGKLVRRHFNQYLIWIKKDYTRYNEDVFKKRFILQTADTKENIQAINKIGYGVNNKGEKKKFGLSIKDYPIFISDMVLGFIDENIYNNLDMENNEQITYRQYTQMCYFLYALIKSFEF